MVTIKLDGDFSKTKNFFEKLIQTIRAKKLEKYGEMGVAALAAATPTDSGKTAASWSCEITVGGNTDIISFSNSNVNKGVNIAIILQYGHGTGTGGYVQGRDYINPAIQPVFDKMVQDIWKEVTML